MAMTHGSLFSGIGGFDLAAEWMGWQNIFHCEIEPFPRKVLNYYWPNAISYHDIKQTDFTVHRGAIDILTGGFPCQPYSTAGKRLGKEDDRHLWPQMLRAIREIQPRWVVGENVRGLISWNGGLVFDEVQADLEAEGYEILPFLLPACAVNASHRRDRVWFVAHSKSISFDDGTRDDRYKTQTIQKRRSNEPVSTPDPGKQRLQGGQFNRAFNEEGQIGGEQSSGSATQLHQTNHWQNFPTQSPVCGGNDGIPAELDGVTFSKWRNESIKGYGNAVVPQLVYEIFKAIEFYESNPHPHSPPR